MQYRVPQDAYTSFSSASRSCRDRVGGRGHLSPPTGDLDSDRPIALSCAVERTYRDSRRQLRNTMPFPAKLSGRARAAGSEPIANLLMAKARRATCCD